MKKVYKDNITTIKIEKKTKDRLEGLKEYSRETYEEVINKILDIINITIRNPPAGAKIFRNIKRKKLGKQKFHQMILNRQETQEELEEERENNTERS